MSIAMRIAVVFTVVFTLVCMSSCAYLRSPNDPPHAVLAKHWDEIDPAHSSHHSGVAKPTIEGLASVLAGQCPVPPPQPNRPLNVLALSAGGKYAAFTAGVLNGWTAQGSRPTFDIVTGVSAGSIVALYAYLGPQYDGKLKAFFTETNQRDLFTTRPLISLVRYGSIATPRGLERIIEEEINDQTLAEIRAAHAAGRCLYLATMNVHTKQLTTWDIGAIASCPRPDAGELVRKIMLATAAVPGMLPPVAFDIEVDGVRYTELHADGGPVSQTFIRLGPYTCPKPGTKWLAGSNLYCIAAGKLDPDPIPGRLTVIDRIGGALSAALYALYKCELMNLYALCVTSGMQFNLASIPQDIELDTNSTRIRASEMRPLFDLGFTTARHGMTWRQRPPGSADGEDDQPRSSLQFRTMPCAPQKP